MSIFKKLALATAAVTAFELLFYGISDKPMPGTQAQGLAMGAALFIFVWVIIVAEHWGLLPKK